MTPSEIARWHAIPALVEHRLSWLIDNILNLEVQFLTELPKSTHKDGSIFAYGLVKGLWVVEDSYVDYEDTFVDENGVIDATNETREYWLVVTDPTFLGIDLDELDSYDRKKFVVTT